MINPLYGTHIPLLAKIMNISDGDVLELGIGDSSTMLLHWLCFDKGRKLVSYENNEKWYRAYRSFNNSFHEVRFIKDFNEADILGRRWSVALIDQHPYYPQANYSRTYTASILKDNCDFVIIHDSEPSHERQYRYRSPRRGCFKHYKYIYEDTRSIPNTTVLSNTIDVSKIL